MRKLQTLLPLELNLRRSLLLCVLTTGACWKPTFNALPELQSTFAPRSGSPIDGWEVSVSTLPLICPDGESSTLTMIRPLEPTAATSTTLLFHSASFDYTYVEVGANKQYRPTDSLTSNWALRRSFTTIGQFVDDVEDDDLTGAIAQALVEQGSQVLIPGNCWGDLWHNGIDPSYVNDVDADGFSRLGGDAAWWTYRLVTEPSFASTQGIENGETLVNKPVYAVGLSEGARAVGEIISRAGVFQGAVLDSMPDDLDVYYADIEEYESIITGLERIYLPDNVPASASSVATISTLPRRTVYLYSTLDELVPAEAHIKAVNRLGADSNHWVQDLNQRGHNLSGQDLTLARESVAHMLNVAVYED